MKFEGRTLRIEKDGKEQLLTVSQFEALTGAAFIPELDFSGFPVLQDIVERTKKIHRKGELTREQMWLGEYYRKEIRSDFFPDVSIRWIDDRVGWGVFSARPFKNMEFIAEYSGKVGRRERSDKKNAYCFEYVIAPHMPTPYTIDAQDQAGIGRLINHSSRPNLRSVLVTLDWISHVLLVADGPIPKGVQLLYDYGPDYWSSRGKPAPL